MKLTGAQILCESLLKEGVDVIFGFPGGVVLPLYRYFPAVSGLTTYPGPTRAGRSPCRGWLCPGYRQSRCLPGYLRSGSYQPGNRHCQCSSGFVPMVAITGQVARPFIGKDAFQEVDITGITLPITKHNYLVLETDDIATVVKEAFYLARTGRPGPVLDRYSQGCLYRGGRIPLSG